ncbi:unnamed protein product [Peronospora belbahrii]|uniref:Uncharacterized protein n=1 Tax=Peronospora belbahrii TaxID=622444 RepID=A0AAU9KZV6_9STRA|nr:unnamed protein product [Peronospora belbahrii]CAH0516137.1 unnamed protein product [Peronospora belbahrii]
MSLTHLPSIVTPQQQHHATLPPLSNQLNQQCCSLLHSSQCAFPFLQQSHHVLLSSTPSSINLTLSGPLRRGKWTRAEENYAAATISYFCDGLLAIQYGTTLRGYLAQQLHCDPMRISKKLLPGSVFAGIKINPKIGRRAYYPCAQDSPAAARSKENAAQHLTNLRQAFIQSIEDEEQALKTTSSGAITDSPPPSTKTLIDTRKSPKPMVIIGRKRSYDDVNSVVLAQHHQGHSVSGKLANPQIPYHFQHQVHPTLFSSRYAATTSSGTSPTVVIPAISKLPKLTITDNVSRHVSYSTQQRSVSPVTVATSAAVLPPLRVSLVRASMS